MQMISGHPDANHYCKLRTERTLLISPDCKFRRGRFLARFCNSQLLTPFEGVFPDSEIGINLVLPG